jgi:hypothetical protein
MATVCAGSSTRFLFEYLSGGNVGFNNGLILTDFTLDLGVAGQGSTLTLSILDGGCNAGAIDTQIPAIGRAIKFQANNLIFCGIVNAVTYTQSSEGFLWKITVKDTTELTNTVTVMYKGYYCPLSAPNFLNVTPIIELRAAICPPGQDSQNWPRVGNCFNYGASGLSYLNIGSNNGVQTLKVILALQNRPVTTSTGENLFLNLSQLYSALYSRAPWSRLSGNASSLKDILDQACDDIACDYVLYLDPAKRINIQLLDRSITPNYGVIANAITQSQTRGTLISSEYGNQEVYEPRNKVVIGDNVSYLAEQSSSRIYMMLGYDSQNRPVRVSNTNFRVPMDIRALNDITNLGLSPEYYISEEEILFAGSMQMWTFYGHINRNSLSYILLSSLGLLSQTGTAVADVLKAYRNLLDPKKDAQDFKQAMNTLSRLPSRFAGKINFAKYELCYQWFKNFIDEWYGTKYLVSLNSFCAFPASSVTKIDGENGIFNLSDAPTDAGYPSPTQLFNLKGLIPRIDTLPFESSEGKFYGFIQADYTALFNRTLLNQTVPFAINMSDLNPGSYTTKGPFVYNKLSIDGGIVKNPLNQSWEVIVSPDNKLGADPFLFTKDPTLAINRGLKAYAALFGQKSMEKISKRDGGYSDITSFNIFALNKAAVPLISAVVPMKSNMYVYGPWTTQNFSPGSTEVIVDTSLNPWSCGGYNSMNQIGSQQATTAIRLTNIIETGSFTEAAPPGYGINAFWNAGLIMDNVNVNFNASGVTTTYSFKTFASKFGNYAKNIADVRKEVIQNRSSVISQIKEERKEYLSKIQNLYNTIAKKATDLFKATQPEPHNRASPGYIFVGGYLGTSKESSDEAGGLDSTTNPEVKNSVACRFLNTTPTSPGAGSKNGKKAIPKLYEVGLNPKHEVESAIDDKAAFAKIAIMSIDGLISPVSIAGRGEVNDNKGNILGNNMPRYAKYSNPSKAMKTRPSMPPLSTAEYPIDQKYLNPVLSKSLLDEWKGRGKSDKGHNIQYVGFGDTIEDLENAEKREQATDFSFHALRGPLVLQSWGYDTENKPIPNIVDAPKKAEQGDFKAAGAKDKFMENWIQNPATWPIGPIDLRFDRDRGVWVAPPNDRIIVVQLAENLKAYSKAQAVLLNPEIKDSKDKKIGSFYEDYYIYDENGKDVGANVTNKKITVYDFIGLELKKGRIVYVAYNDGKYIVVQTPNAKDNVCDGDDCDYDDRVIRLGKYNGYWSNAHGKNMKTVTLYEQPSRATDPYDWVPQLDASGNPIVVSAINFFAYLPSKAGGDRSLWCAVTNIACGGWFTSSTGARRKYDSLYLLLAAEV